MKRITATVAAAAVLVAGLGATASMAQLTKAAPDLVPIPSRLVSSGTVSVQNKGSAAAGAFVIAIRCDKQGGGGGGCAEMPISRQYIDPKYPGRLVVKVPSLAKGHVFNHALPFWNSLVWAPGNYNFVMEADAGKAVAETNEGNNIMGAVLSK